MKYSDPVSALESTGEVELVAFIKYWVTSRKITKYLEATLSKHTKLSLVQGTCLHALSVNNEGMRPTDLARWIVTERHNITTMIRRMEKSGLVKIKRDKNSQREVRVTITEKGKKIQIESVPIAREIIKQMMSSFTSDELIQMQRICKMMADNTYKKSEINIQSDSR